MIFLFLAEKHRSQKQGLFRTIELRELEIKCGETIFRFLTYYSTFWFVYNNMMFCKAEGKLPKFW